MKFHVFSVCGLQKYLSSKASADKFRPSDFTKSNSIQSFHPKANLSPSGCNVRRHARLSCGGEANFDRSLVASGEAHHSGSVKAVMRVMLAKPSIARAAILPVACVLIAIAGVAIAILASQYHTRSTAGLLEKASLTAQVIAPSAAAAAWQFDTLAGSRVLQSLTSDFDFASGIIVDDKGQFFAGCQSSAAPIAPITTEAAAKLVGSSQSETLKRAGRQSFILPDQVVVVTRLVSNDGRWADVGYMVLSFSRGRAGAMALKEMLALAVGGSFTLLAVCALLAWILSNVTRPIRELTWAMDQLSAGMHDTPIPALQRLDEIGAMARALAIFKENSIERQRLESLTSSLQQATDELRREGEKVKHLANHDALTGLANRTNFADRLHNAFAAARQEGRSFAVLCFDLDHFKDVNDTLGHKHGDILLQTVARRLEGIMRENDVISRLGGDEFAVLITDETSLEIIATIARRINVSLAEPFSIDGDEVHVSASIGISVYDAGIASPGEMMIQADLALYQTKELGRNGFSFHSPDLDHHVRERVAIAGELHAALQRRELELHYQPQVEIASGRIVGLEALVRWRHPTRGLLPPGAFVPVAETSGIIVPLGRWILEECCRQMKAWREEGVVPPLVAVNISAAQLRMSPQFDSELAALFEQYDVPPRRIELELTEQAIMEVTGQQTCHIEQIRSLGCGLAIDDFGTGHSSLASLGADNVSRLKIARQFVQNIAGNSRDAAIVRATVSLARELGIEVIAEGIETDQQLRLLDAAGCRYAQGYYYCPPIPAAVAAGLLRKGVITPDHDHPMTGDQPRQNDSARVA